MHQTLWECLLTLHCQGDILIVDGNNCPVQTKGGQRIFVGWHCRQYHIMA